MLTKSTRKNQLIQWINVLLVINFINLSANFYNSDSMFSHGVKVHDPIDTLAEIIVEFIFDFDNHIIPDTESSQNERKFKDFKLFCNQPFGKEKIEFVVKLKSWPLINEVLHLSNWDDITGPPPEV
ncbi:hypothetical protein ACFOUP_15805 [Belliella kenyensis]|uniref:Uncharacterized protein n=1 Tax=Belliella kenyensis TaxID=1472724 RepID=A0ABV8ERA5_9BACT|nr:hypothetical protein [Belliella kenyensis]MCH7401977.1 hypothetical protein [Belliella kenyensis]MDN3605141.1 hypothetical protein [Belliella kenyensis]